MYAASLNDTDRDILRRSVLCSAMNDEEMCNMLASGTITKLEPGDYLFEQSDKAKNLFIILSGWVQISRLERDGSTTLIAAFHKGESVAEAAAFLGKPYPASAEAMSPLRVLSVNGGVLMDTMQSNRGMLARSLASVFLKLHNLVDEVESLKSCTIRERVAKFLLEQTQTGAVEGEVLLPYSKSLIAAKIGTSPQQLSRTFTELQSFGVHVSGRKVSIESRDLLKAMIEKS